MKILNREKTHFMQPSADGDRNVKFGKVNEVHALIDTILDGKKDNNTDKKLHVVSADKTDQSNN